MLELLRRGVFINPMGTKLYLSIAHTTADIEAFTQRLTDALIATRP
jgi:glutamate-1-semialdehyde 2,1-aminomutase